MKKIVVFLFIITLANLKPITVKSQAVKVADSLALVDFYNSTNGQLWARNLTWLKGPVNTWQGITLSTGGDVTNINLNGYGLSGKIPKTIGNLTNLVELSLALNDTLGGSIPAEIGNCSKLEILNVWAGNLSGNIPDEIGKLTNLQQITLAGNELSGNLPASLGNLLKLTLIDIGNNKLTGLLPSSLGNLKQLSQVILGGNKFSGSIPPSLGNMSNLNYLDLSYNQLSGSIPKELSKASKLAYIYLYNNHFSGDVDSALVSPSKPELHFNITHNYFTFSTLEKLQKLLNRRGDFSVQDTILPVHYKAGKLSVFAGGTVKNNTYNWFNGPTLITTMSGDSTFTPVNSGNYYVKVTNGLVADVKLKSDTFKITSLPIPKLDSLALVDLYSKNGGAKWVNKTNWLKGPIVTWYGVTVDKLGKVKQIHLGNNNLTGSLSASINYLDSLDILALDSNALTGSMPPSVTGLKPTLKIYLRNNYFNFDALEVVARYFKSAYYSPQRTVIPNVVNYVWGYGNLTATAGGGAGFGLTYIWYRDSQLVYKATGQYSSYTYQPSIGGNYYVAVTDSAAKGVTLYSGVSRFYSKHEKDSLTLVDLYNSTNGAGWKHKDGWLKAPLNQWYGITLDGNSLVKTLNLQNNNLAGKIPASIQNLTAVTIMLLDSNKLSGNIPGELYNCSGLGVLSLSHNLFTGQVPHLMNGLYNLVGFNISYNLLSGVLDSTQINNYWLTSVDISHNNFSGHIPDIFTQHNPFTGLKSVNLSYNKFSGDLPATTYYAFRMYTFDVSYNNLIGNIPKFQSFHLDFLNLSHNKFTGPIPTEYHYLSGMRTLLLNNNNLSGAIPPLTVFQYLDTIDISNNRFTFTGLEALAQQYTKVNYRPQHTIHLGYNQKHFYVHAGGNFKNNTYKWYKNNVLVSTIKGDSTFTPAAKGSYFVTVNNKLAPKLTLHSDTLAAPDSLMLTVPYVDSTGEVSHSTALLGTNTAVNTPVIWPNPVTNVLTLKWAGAPTEATYIITSIEGKQLLMQKQTGSAQQVQLNTQQLAASTYILTILTADGQKHSLKFIKQ